MVEIASAFRFVTPSGHLQYIAAGSYAQLPAHTVEAAKKAGALKMRDAPDNKARKRAPRNKAR